MGGGLLGEDGRGYELARLLEGCGAWISWLRRGRGDDGVGGGDSDDYYYTTFVHSLSSPSAWDSFMSPPPSSSSSQSQQQQQQMIHLQLRVRALLFDKASISLFLPSSSASSSSSDSISNLNPHYLQLHGDDVYFSLKEEEEYDEHTISPPIQAQSRSGSKGNDHPYERSSTAVSRYSEPENINIPQRYRHEELSANHYSGKFKTRYHKFQYADKESLKRTPEGMSAYLQLRERHKRKRQSFKDDLPMNVNGSLSENVSHMHPKMIADTNGSPEEDFSFFPEIMFPSNCVPDSSLPLRDEVEANQKVEFYGILDNLPTVVSRSTAMMERFGIKPEYIRVGSKYRGVDGSGCEKKPLCQEQASVMTHKIVARLLVNTGFEGGTGNSIEVFSEFFSSHICKLGRTLKLITDSYKKQFSSIELLQMFLQTAGYNNLGVLVESIKDGNKGIITQTPQHVRAIQSQHQNSLLQTQQLQRQLHSQPQMNMLPSQNLTFQQQQQLEKMRRRQATASMADVKIENMMESSPVDTNTLNTLTKQQAMQLRQQQLQQQQMAMANHHALAAQSSPQQFRQLQSTQIPQLPMQNTYGMRTAPVKVEAFHELMGVDSTMKHDPELNKLSSPPNPK